VNRLGRRTALVTFGWLQGAAVGGYAYLAMGEPSRTALYAICATDHFTGGLATAALFTCMMDWCAPATAATDYTVQASAVVIATGAASAVAGFSAQHLGYFRHFCLATALALATLVVAALCFPGEHQMARLRGALREVPSCR
jgi:predicted MFS family arabinose efflux permease